MRKALESAEKEGAEVETWSIVGKEVRPCDHCGSCIKTGQCYIKDDMLGLYPKLIEADGIVLGSPVYFWSIAAQAKLVIDRTYALRRPINRLEGKVGGAIAVAGRRGVTEALMTINSFFLGQGMTPAGLGVDGKGSEKGDVKKDERGMIEAAELGRRMVEFVQKSKLKE